MAEVFGNFEKMSVLRLYRELLKRIKKLLTLEREYLKQQISPQIKSLSPWIIFVVIGLVLLCLGGLWLILSLTLFLNTWFMPWASALIVAIAFLVVGITLSLIGAINTKKRLDKTKELFNELGEDVQCLKKK